MTDYVTFTAAGQLFGLPIEHVQDVFTLANITRIPLAGREVAGVLNLRGRIVTVIDLANRLQLDVPSDANAHMVIGIERGSESFRPRSISTVFWPPWQPEYSGSTRRFSSRSTPIAR